MKRIQPVAIAFLFAATAAFSIAGCADANATEMTYLPIHDACPFESSDTDWSVDPTEGLEEDSTEVQEADQASDDPSDWLWLQDQPYLSSAVHVPTEQGDALEAANYAPTNDGGAGAVDINSADADELTTLPGIGPALAERIVDYRRDRRFESTDQLQRVSGIGPATLENIAEMVVVR